MTYIGIDLGVNGAVAIWKRRSGTPTIHPFPVDAEGETDGRELAKLLISDDETVCIYESVFKPNSLVRKQGAAAAICDAAGVDSHRAVAVVTWKKKLLGVNDKDKQKSIDFVRSFWPDINLRRTARSRTDWHDAADAVSLMLYGVLLYDGSLPDRSGSNGS